MTLLLTQVHTLLGLCYPCWHPWSCDITLRRFVTHTLLARDASESIDANVSMPASASVPTKKRLCSAGLTTTKRASARFIRHRAGGAARHVELRVPNTRRKYSAGQWVFLCVPRLGLLHWHPFTISSSGFDKDLTLHFTCRGRWTSKVAALAQEEPTIKVRCSSC